MRISITIQERPYHALILRTMQACLPFEEINASLRERNGDLLRLFTKYQLARRGEKILDDTQSPKRLICVLYLLSHKFVDLVSNTLHRKCESHVADT
jgi:hypothetical protein